MDEVFRAYLTWTDWYTVRLAETGTPIPPLIALRRAEARESILKEMRHAHNFDNYFTKVDKDYEIFVKEKAVLEEAVIIDPAPLVEEVKK